jgi:hypothetical protein
MRVRRAVVMGRNRGWNRRRQRSRTNSTRNGVTIPGATKVTYVLTAADSGAKIGFIETVTKTGWDTASASSSYALPGF